jgi:hypothetical protein
MFLRVWQRGFAEPGTILTLGVLTLMIVGTLIGSVYIKEPTSTSTKAAICDSYGNCCATEGEFCGQGGHTCCQHPTVSEPLYCGTDYLCKRTSGGCSKDSDCSTNYCENGTCQPKKNNGESCTRNEACFYGICLNSVCVAPSPVPTRTPTPIPTITPTKSPDCAAENEYCGQGGKSCCASFVCTNSVCKRSNTSICSLDSHCATGYCINGSCQQKLSNGSTCSIDANCISNICVQNLCQNKMADYQPCSIGYHCQSGHCGLSPAGYICLPATSPASPAPTPITANPDACAINPSSPECIASTLQTSTNQYACYTAPTSPECQAYRDALASQQLSQMSEYDRQGQIACRDFPDGIICKEYLDKQLQNAALVYGALGAPLVIPLGPAIASYAGAWLSSIPASTLTTLATIGTGLGIGADIAGYTWAEISCRQGNVAACNAITEMGIYHMAGFTTASWLSPISAKPRSFYYDHVYPKYGKVISENSDVVVYLDKNTNTITKIFLGLDDIFGHNTPTNQIHVYEQYGLESDILGFKKTVPGGFQQTYHQNTTDLRSYLNSGGQLSQTAINNAVSDLQKLQNLTKQAHGDLAYYIDRPNPVLNTGNILVQTNPDNSIRLIPIDYAGVNYWARFPSPDGTILPTNPMAMADELTFYQSTLDNILKQQQGLPMIDPPKPLLNNLHYGSLATP